MTALISRRRLHLLDAITPIIVRIPSGTIYHVLVMVQRWPGNVNVGDGSLDYCVIRSLEYRPI